jgi:hypothetical protein
MNPGYARRRLTLRCLAALTAVTASAAVVGIVTTPAGSTDPRTAARTESYAGARTPGGASLLGRGPHPERPTGTGPGTVPGPGDALPGATAAATPGTVAAPPSAAPSPPHRSTRHGAAPTTPATRATPRAGGGTTQGATAPAPAAPATSSGTGPLGRPGSWRLAFDDEFDGTALDTDRWSANDGDHMNDVTTRATNVAVTGGNLVLTLSSPTTGAYVNSGRYAGARTGFLLPVGGYAEARVEFPGNGGTVYNWPAWWISSGPAWPAGGEHDIVEGLGTATVNYHNATGAHNFGTIPGTWSNTFHVYGIHRAADHADVYWDGHLVKSYPTSDNGAGQALVLNVGNGSYGGPTVTGAASRVVVDYVRAWLPGR